MSNLANKSSIPLKHNPIEIKIISNTMTIYLSLMPNVQMIKRFAGPKIIKQFRRIAML